MSARQEAGTFAYRLTYAARHDRGVPLLATRKANCADEAFMAEYREACARVRAMEFRVVEITGGTLSALFEIYAAVQLRTPYNSFATS